MLKRIFEVFCKVVFFKIVLLKSMNAFAGFAVGMGGDPVAIALQYAQRSLVARIPFVDLSEVKKIASQQSYEWMVKNKDALAADLASSILEISENSRDDKKCAWTNVPGTGKSIFFNIADCSKTLKSGDDALSLLIHEASHHFGTNEDLANELGYVVLESIKRTENHKRPYWETIFDPNGNPEGRTGHSAIWTGHTGDATTENRMIVFGGCTLLGMADQCLNIVGQPISYFSAKNLWSSFESTNELLSPRQNHTAAWTGHSEVPSYKNKMIVWGGCSGENCKTILGSGFVFDPATQTLSKIPEGANAPSPRVRHEMIWDWELSKLFVWGGQSGYSREATVLSDGAVFDAKLNKWFALPKENAPTGRTFFSATKMGSKIFIWGGCETTQIIFSCSRSTNTGAYIDLAAPDSQFKWVPIGTENAPSARFKHSMVSTGQSLIVWGGQNSNGAFEKTGAAYDPETGKWIVLNSLGPSARAGHTAVWDGEKMIIVGGYRYAASRVERPLDVGEFQVVGNDFRHARWTVQSYQGADRDLHSSLWTDESILIWGGRSEQAGALNDGFVFAPLWK